MSRRLRRTKIVTTLGPATDRDNNLEKVIAAGANVVRMNFSHGSPETRYPLSRSRLTASCAATTPSAALSKCTGVTPR